MSFDKKYDDPVLSFQDFRQDKKRLEEARSRLLAGNSDEPKDVVRLVESDASIRAFSNSSLSFGQWVPCRVITGDGKGNYAMEAVTTGATPVMLEHVSLGGQGSSVQHIPSYEKIRSKTIPLGKDGKGNLALLDDMQRFHFPYAERAGLSGKGPYPATIKGIVTKDGKECVEISIKARKWFSPSTWFGGKKTVRIPLDDVRSFVQPRRNMAEAAKQLEEKMKMRGVSDEVALRATSTLGEDGFFKRHPNLVENIEKHGLSTEVSAAFDAALAGYLPRIQDVISREHVETEHRRAVLRSESLSPEKALLQARAMFSPLMLTGISAAGSAQFKDAIHVDQKGNTTVHSCDSKSGAISSRTYTLQQMDELYKGYVQHKPTLDAAGMMGLRAQLEHPDQVERLCKQGVAEFSDGRGGAPVLLSMQEVSAARSAFEGGEGVQNNHYSVEIGGMRLSSAVRRHCTVEADGIHVHEKFAEESREIWKSPARSAGAPSAQYSQAERDEKAGQQQAHPSASVHALDPKVLLAAEGCGLALKSQGLQQKEGGFNMPAVTARGEQAAQLNVVR